MRFSPFLLEDEYNQTEDIYSSTLSSATFPPLNLREIMTEIPDLDLDYSSAFGSLELRQRLALMHHASERDFLLCSAASEGILLVFTLLAGPGKKFLVQQPIYQSLFQIAADLGAELISWDGSLDSLGPLLARGADAVVINNPNNPSGEVFTNEDLQQISSLLEKYSSPYLIADEVFRFSSLVEVDSVMNFYERAIVISDFSKSFACPGLRLGWLASADHDFLSLALAQRNYFSLRTNIVSEFLALKILDQADEILERNKNIVRQNFSFLEKHRQDLPFEFMVKQFGGPCLFPRVTDRERLFSDADCFVATGEYFYSDATRFRLGLGAEPTKFAKQLSAKILSAL